MLVACWSPKGGVGKTVLAAALAYRLADLGQPVTLVDLDPQKADLATLLQAPSRPSLLDWPLMAAGRDDLPPEALAHLPGGVDFLPGPARVVEEVAVGRELAERLVAVLARRPGVAVLDVASALRDSTLVALERADAVLLVITPDLLALRAAYTFVQDMRLVGLDPARFRLVLNRAGRGISRGEVEELLPLPLVAALPSFPPLAQAVNHGVGSRILRRSNRFTRSVAEVARALLGRPAAERRWRWPLGRTGAGP